MKKAIITAAIALAVLLSACVPPQRGGLRGELGPTPTQIAVSTLPPPTATNTPLPSPSPTLMATPVVVQVTAPQPTATPTETPLPEPTATPVPDWLNTSGRTADTLMYRGNPNAPLIFIDFSDFM